MGLIDDEVLGKGEALGKGDADSAFQIPIAQVKQVDPKKKRPGRMLPDGRVLREVRLEERARAKAEGKSLSYVKIKGTRNKTTYLKKKPGNRGGPFIDKETGAPKSKNAAKQSEYVRQRRAEALRRRDEQAKNERKAQRKEVNRRYKNIKKTQVARYALAEVGMKYKADGVVGWNEREGKAVLNIFEGRVDPRNDPEAWVLSKLPAGWDWLKPDYDAVLWERAARLQWLRETPGAWDGLLQVYSDPAGFYDWVMDWGTIFDPRVAAFGRETEFPFVLFPKQVEMLTWIDRLVSAPARGESGKGNISKTRGCGASTLACAYAVWRWRFFAKTAIGFGSNVMKNVWDMGNPKSLFWKIEKFMEVPQELLPIGFDRRTCFQKGQSAGKLLNPENGSTITGDGGADIGRGDRTLIYFVDEHASLDFPTQAEAALSKTTNTLIRISTEKPNSFFSRQCEAMRQHSPELLFEFDWWNDPRMTEEIFARERAEAESQPGMLAIFQVEVERNVTAAVVDTFIPREVLLKAQQVEAVPHGPAVIAVDVAAAGNDQSVVGYRRGLWTGPLLKQAFSGADGRQLAGLVQIVVEELLKGGVEVGAIIYEHEGPGYALHAVLAGGPLARLLRPVHPGRKLDNGRHWNVRAQAWDCWHKALLEGANVPNDPNVVQQASTLSYVWKERSKNGAKLLLMEEKERYRRRLSADRDNPRSGPSPDEADCCALMWLPVEMTPMDYGMYLAEKGVQMEWEGAPQDGGDYGWFG